MQAIVRHEVEELLRDMGIGVESGSVASSKTKDKDKETSRPDLIAGHRRLDTVVS